MTGIMGACSSFEEPALKETDGKEVCASEPRMSVAVAREIASSIMTEFSEDDF